MHDCTTIVCRCVGERSPSPHRFPVPTASQGSQSPDKHSTPPSRRRSPDPDIIQVINIDFFESVYTCTCICTLLDILIQYRLLVHVHVPIPTTCKCSLIPRPIPNFQHNIEIWDKTIIHVLVYTLTDEIITRTMIRLNYSSL